MRRIIITERDYGALSQYVVETSAGVRATGSTLEGTLAKLAPVGAAYDGIGSFETVFRAIRPTATGGQVSRGQASG